VTLDRATKLVAEAQRTGTLAGSAARALHRRAASSPSVSGREMESFDPGRGVAFARRCSWRAAEDVEAAVAAARVGIGRPRGRA
jgi:aldehyde dehydrogenase (NAD+)